MRTSHFAQIQVIVPDYPDDNNEITTQSILKTVGMAQSLRVEDTFGATSENVIGTPLPVMAPGYQLTNVSIEKATIDGRDFRNLGAFNPLWAHVGSTYSNPTNIAALSGGVGLDGIGTEGNNNSSMYPFMFIITTRNKVSDSYGKTNISREDEPVGNAVGASDGTARENPFGTYVCILRTATISLSSQNVMIMDNMSAIARPLAGGWFNEAIQKAYSTENVGLADIVNSALFGFNAQNLALSSSSDA